MGSAHTGQKEKDPELVLYKKDNVMPVFLKSIKIYLGLEKKKIRKLDPKSGLKAC